MDHDPSHNALPNPLFPLREIAHANDADGDDVGLTLLYQLRERLRREEEERTAEAHRIHFARQEERERQLTTMGDD